MQKLFSKRKLLVVILLVYTYLNLRILYPFLFDEGHTSYLLAAGLQNGGMGLLAIFIGLFLNIASILYFLRD